MASKSSSRSRRRRRRIWRRFAAVLKWPLRILKKLHGSITRVTRVIFTAVRRWLATRQFWYLLRGLPVIVVAGTAAYFLISGGVVTPAQQMQKYVSAAQAATRAGNWPRVRLYYERALELGLRDPDALLELAKAAEEEGDGSRVAAMMEYLAPDDRAVHGSAHLWRAANILSGSDVEQGKAVRAEKQLQFVLELDPKNTLAHGILGDLYFQTGVLEPAIQHLSQADRQSPFYQLKLAKALIANGDAAGGKSRAIAVLPFARAACEQDLRSVDARLEWAEATLLADEDEEAFKILREGMALAPDPRLKEAATLVLIHWSDRLLRESPENRAQAFQLLSLGFENSPNEILLFDRTMKLLSGEDAVADDAEEFLTQNITSGRASGLSHLILGTHLLTTDKLDEADFHLRQAFELFPNAPVVANNFAYFLVRNDPPDPERALGIIDTVIREYPNHPEFFDTRAHVLAKLGQWEDAITDFEKSLQAFPERLSTHVALADAYGQIGLQNLADRHRQIAEQLKSRQE